MTRRKPPHLHKRNGRPPKYPAPTADSIEPLDGPMPEFSTAPRPQIIAFRRNLASNEVPTLDQLFPKESK